jgi:putative transposase
MPRCGRARPARPVQLPSWTAFGAEDPLHERAVEQMLVGVSTRRYARSLEPLPADLPSRGTSRSAVSRRFAAATERQMTEWLGRTLTSGALARHGFVRPPRAGISLTTAALF